MLKLGVTRVRARAIFERYLYLPNIANVRLFLTRKCVNGDNVNRPSQKDNKATGGYKMLTIKFYMEPRETLTEPDL